MNKFTLHSRLNTIVSVDKTMPQTRKCPRCFMTYSDKIKNIESVYIPNGFCPICWYRYGKAIILISNGE